ncbi:MAG TPA: endonuclease MutS2 [Candidatus Obscuribacterales bacterium]
MDTNSTPMEVESRALRTLEWDKLRTFLAIEAETAPGKELCLSLMPVAEQAIAEILLDETREALAVIEARSGWSLESLPDLKETLERLKAGAVLAPQDLNDARKTMVHARQVRKSLALLSAESFPRLVSYFPRLHSLDEAINAIAEAIDDEARVKDEASPHLANLKRELRRLDANIKEELTRIIHSPTKSKALQEPIFTQRNGRYVLPVNASQRHVIQGIVHDSSASGMTVYVEPMVVVELANKARIKEAEVEHEIARIVARLTDTVSKRRSELQSSYDALIELDVIFARARIATKYNGTRPELTPNLTFEIEEARHPLLVLQRSPEVVVPNGIALGGDKRTLVITGPNTGGKTVLLKLVGLIALMVRAGLLIPAKSGSKAAFFARVFADIGDEQSLEQSLSTFSSHMTNIVEIIERAGEGTLVLLDEIGAGTDPKEGAAIARAVLEFLNSRGAVTVSTTHFGQLKTLAYNVDGFVNGSLEFDDATLSPTYRLKLGTPGSSKGITIARRLGLKEDVVASSLKHLDQDSRDIDATVDRLEAALNEAINKKEGLEAEARVLDDLKRQYEKKIEELDREREAALKEQFGLLESEIAAAREKVRQITCDLQREPSLAKAQAAQKQIADLLKDLGWLSSTRSGATAFQVGDTVKVVSLNQVGTVEAVPEEAREGATQPYVVRAGAMKIKVQASDLSKLTEPGKSKRRSGARSPSAGYGKRQEPVAFFLRTDGNTLDLRGERVDAGLARLERFLDEAVLSGVSPLMIIHGHGTGAMKEAVRGFLAGSPYANSYRPGEVHEGGDGVTIVDV